VTERAIDTVVFDIGNVLLVWDPRFVYRSVFADDADMEAFLAEVCTMAWHTEHDRGVSFEDNAAALKALHPDHGPAIDLWQARFHDMIPGPVPGAAELMARLKDKGVAMHGLTNMPHGVLPVLRERFAFLNGLDTVIVSAEEKMVKPEPGIYQVALERAGAVAEKTLFVDDNFANVAGAQACGLHGHHFQDAGRLAAALQDFGLL